jgi:G2/mitotic-specific cyclin-B, other
MDIDEEASLNPYSHSEYAVEVFDYLSRVEPLGYPNPNYMASQTDINEKMRAILIDWLNEVHLKFKLVQDTLFLAIQIIDRFLSIVDVPRSRLQLVGVTAMFVASKFEEVSIPEVNDFVYICDNAFTREQIIEMEQTVLNKLQFNLSFPTPCAFVKRFHQAAEGDEALLHTISLLVELSLIEYSAIRHPPSLLAAAATSVALTLRGKEPWVPSPNEPL